MPPGFVRGQRMCERWAPHTARRCAGYKWGSSRCARCACGAQQQPAADWCPGASVPQLPRAVRSQEILIGFVLHSCQEVLCIGIVYICKRCTVHWQVVRGCSLCEVGGDGWRAGGANQVMHSLFCTGSTAYALPFHPFVLCWPSHTTCARVRFYVSDQELYRLFKSTNGLILPVCTYVHNLAV